VSRTINNKRSKNAEIILWRVRLVTRRIICGLQILYLNLSVIHQAELQLLATLPILYHTNQHPLLVLNLPRAGVNLSWGASVMNCCVELLWQTPIVDCLDNQSLTAFIISAINCWSVRCHDTYMLTGRCLVATIPHCSGCRGYLAYRTVESNLVASVDTQFAWIICPSPGNGYLPP
jgi:hypothetical protein